MGFRPCDSASALVELHEEERDQKEDKIKGKDKLITTEVRALVSCDLFNNITACIVSRHYATLYRLVDTT